MTSGLEKSSASDEAAAGGAVRPSGELCPQDDKQSCLTAGLELSTSHLGHTWLS